MARGVDMGHALKGIAVKRSFGGLLGILALLVGGWTGWGNKGGGNPPPPGQLVVSPSSGSLRGGDTQPFTAQLNGTAAAVNWSVNGVAGGNSSVGMITTAGAYTAPEFPPSPNAVTIGAVATADSSKTASSAVTLNNPVPQITTVTPTSIQVGTFN